MEETRPQGRTQARHGPRNILIAVDASEYSLESVRYVGRLLPAETTTITLLHVLDPNPECFSDLELMSSMEPDDFGTHAWAAQQKKIMQQFMERAESLLVSLGYPENGVSISIREREAGIARDIAAEAHKGYDALVVGRKGMSAVRDLIMGSTAHKLVSSLDRVAVWVVGGSPEPGGILVAMDSSEGARRALQYVGRIFGRAHPDLLLLHVARGLDLRQPGFEDISPEDDWLRKTKDELKKAEDAMGAVFEDSIDHLRRQGADASRIKTRILPGVYSRAAAIFGEAMEEGCGTIVVGRRGLSRVEEFVMGRVSSKVLQLAREMAVWVVPEA